MYISFSLELLIGFAFGCACTGILIFLLRLRAQQRELLERSKLQSELAWCVAQLEEAKAHVAAERSKTEELLVHNDDLSNEIAALTERTRNYEQHLKNLSHIEERFSASFDALAARALHASNEQFLTLAQQSFLNLKDSAQADLSAKEESFKQLVEPIQLTLNKVQEKLSEVERDRISASSTMQEHLRGLLDAHSALRSETAQLSQALRSPNIRGAWGEMQLRRVVEFSGMLEHCDFEAQAFREGTSDTNATRPDLVIRLPNNRLIIVDAKTPLSAFLEAQASENPLVRKEGYKQHAQQLRAQVRNLASKKYWDKFSESPEFVVLFVPGEVFFSVALEHDPALLEDAFAERVVIATPTTLIALLKAVAYGWRSEKMTENALVISELAKTLVDRIASLHESFETLGSSLTRSVDAYNKSVRHLDERVLQPARRMASLGASTASAPEPGALLTATVLQPKIVNS